MLDKLDSSTHELRRAPAEGHLGAASSAEEVGHERKVAPLDPGEEKGRPTSGDNPPVDLRHLEVRINRCIDNRNVTVAAELRDKRPQVGKTDIVHERNITSPANLQFQSF